jgi:hypothetical protein
MKRQTLFATRKGQMMLGFAFLFISIILMIDYASTYGLVQETPILRAILSGHCSIIDGELALLPESILNVRIGIYLIFIPMIASVEYFLRALTKGTLHQYRTQLANGRFYTRWIFRCIWSSLMLFLVALVFGIFSSILHVTLIMLNILSHVFLIEMDRTNEDLSYIDWVPYVISTLLFIGQVVFMLAVGFESGSLSDFPLLFRAVIVVYLLLNVGFYLNAFFHYSGISKWRRFDYSDLTLTISSWMTNVVMAIMLTLLMAQ